MDPKEFFEAVALDYGWKPIYARRDFANTYEVVQWLESEIDSYHSNETIMVIDPIKRSKGSNSGSMVYSGSLLILTVSDLDETYEKKHEKFIKPLIPVVHGTFENTLRCTYDVERWESIEVINQFDRNADGLSVSYNLKLE